MKDSWAKCARWCRMKLFPLFMLPGCKLTWIIWSPFLLLASCHVWLLTVCASLGFAFTTSFSWLLFELSCLPLENFMKNSTSFTRGMKYPSCDGSRVAGDMERKNESVRSTPLPVHLIKSQFLFGVSLKRKLISHQFHPRRHEILHQQFQSI